MKTFLTLTRNLVSICTQLQSYCTTLHSTFIMTQISPRISTHKGEAIEVKWRRSRHR